jgi:hypothetical protein
MDLFTLFHPLMTALRQMRMRARLRYCDRALQAIARQRDNDFEAERILHREMAELRVALGERVTG